MRLQQAIRTGPVVLDGGLATTLEARGHDLSSELWSARMLVEDPQEITAVHEAFLDAGAQVLTTASYQASIGGFATLGLDAEAAVDAIAHSVALARAAITRWRRRTGSSEPRWIAGSVGPYGAALADGSEYTGVYDATDDQLRAFHTPRVAALAAGGADVLAIETQPRLDEARVALAVATEHDLPAWVSFTTRDGVTLPDGTPVADAARTVADRGAIAVGVNCCPPAAAARALELLDDVPATVAYPNLGAQWDDRRRRWVRAGGSAGPAPAADLVGGCCGTAPDDLAVLVRGLRDRGG